MSDPKLHHYVPQAYQSRFGLDEQVLVKRRDPAKVYPSNVKNIAAETGFYTIIADDGTKSTVVETELSKLDSLGVEAMRWIDENGELPAAGTKEREILCEYLAVQFKRTPRERGMIMFPRKVAEYAGDKEITVDLVAEYLRLRHLGRKPRENEARAAWTWMQGLRSEAGGDPTKTDAVLLTLRGVEGIMSRLRARHWRLEVSRKPQFLTSDAPMVLWRKPSPKDRFSGIGIEDADEIRFPLNGSAQLVLVPGRGSSVCDVSLARMWECNRDLAKTCNQVVIGHPGRAAWADKIVLNKRGPALRFNMAPGYEELPDGRVVPTGNDILHLTTL